MMHRAGQQEAAVLAKLAVHDPHHKGHIVRLHDSFEYMNHMCLVFDSLAMNLRQVRWVCWYAGF